MTKISLPYNLPSFSFTYIFLNYIIPMTGITAYLILHTAHSLLHSTHYTLHTACCELHITGCSHEIPCELCFCWCFFLMCPLLVLSHYTQHDTASRDNSCNTKSVWRSAWWSLVIFWSFYSIEISSLYLGKHTHWIVHCKLYIVWSHACVMNSPLNRVGESFSAIDCL